MTNRKKVPRKFYLGIIHLSFSIGISVGTLSSWVFSSISGDFYLTFNSGLIAGFFIGLLGVILGIIGGLLVGSGWREFKDSLT